MDSEMIRVLNSNDMLDSVRLGEYAFKYDLTEEQRIERIKEQVPEQFIGMFIDGQLASRMYILPLQISIRGKCLKMGGIGGVATWPEYRGKGSAAKLIAASLKLMKENGTTISYLHPFSYTYYRKFGWEILNEFKTYEIPTALLANKKMIDGRFARTNDWQHLNSIYENYVARFSGMMLRDEIWWRKLVDQSKAYNTIFYDSNGRGQGYIRYKAIEDELIVYEFVHLTEEARMAMLSYIADHRSLVEKVVLRFPASDFLPFLLPEPTISQKITPDFMARIVDLSSFLQQYPFSSDGNSYHIHLQVEDQHAAWNNGFFLVKIGGNGQVEVNRYASELAPIDPVIVDIATLTSMLLGYQRPHLLRDMNKLRASDENIACLERLIPSTSTHFADHF